jgi:hypothetical protein
LGNTKVGDVFKDGCGSALKYTGGSDYKKHGVQKLCDNLELIEPAEFYFTIT